VINDGILGKPAETVTMFVPCCLYFIQNNLLLLAVANLDAPVYYLVSQVPESSLAPCTGEGRSRKPTQRPGARRACWRLPRTSHGAAAESFFVYFIFTCYALWQLVLFLGIESCTQCTEYPLAEIWRSNFGEV